MNNKAFTNAWGDLARALMQWRQWTYMASSEIIIHYQRSILGPFWMSINTMVMVGGFTLVYSYFFHLNAEFYAPYVAGGLLAWNLITALINEGSVVFTQNAVAIRNLNMPLTFYVFRALTKQTVIFLHSIVIMIPIYLLFPWYLSVNLLLVPLAVALLLLNGTACLLLFGMVCSRFRDAPNFIASVLQVTFFLTPIFWPAESTNHRFLVDWNVFYHLIEIFRAPLLGRLPTALNWEVSILCTVVMIAAAFLTFVRFRPRIVHTL